MSDDDDVITEAQAAELLGCSPNTLAQRRHRARKGNRKLSPPWYRVADRSIRYRRSEVLSWQAARNELVPEDPAA